MHRDGLEQAGEPSAHSVGKRRSAGMWTGSAQSAGMQEGAGECRRARASAGGHGRVQRVSESCENRDFISQGESRHIISSPLKY